MSEVKNYVVLCRADRRDGEEWEMVVATRRLFTEMGAQRYASTVAESRAPRVMTAAEYLTGFCGWRLERES